MAILVCGSLPKYRLSIAIHYLTLLNLVELWQFHIPRSVNVCVCDADAPIMKSLGMQMLLHLVCASGESGKSEQLAMLTRQGGCGAYTSPLANTPARIVLLAPLYHASHLPV